MPTARYSFRHFVIDAETGAPREGAEPNFGTSASESSTAASISLQAAKAVEAGGRVGGPAGFWAMHIWVLKHQQTFNQASLTRQLEIIGIDAARFIAEMESREVADAIRADMQVAMSLEVPTLPIICVNGRWVPRWRLEGERILERILNAAKDEARATSGAEVLDGRE